MCSVIVDAAGTVVRIDRSDGPIHVPLSNRVRRSGLAPDELTFSDHRARHAFPVCVPSRNSISPVRRACAMQMLGTLLGPELGSEGRCAIISGHRAAAERTSLSRSRTEPSRTERRP
jgi:hypothetical protein